MVLVWDLVVQAMRWFLSVSETRICPDGFYLEEKPAKILWE